jgi:hypothetical protein
MKAHWRESETVKPVLVHVESNVDSIEKMMVKQT